MNARAFRFTLAVTAAVTTANVFSNRAPAAHAAGDAGVAVVAAPQATSLLPVDATETFKLIGTKANDAQLTIVHADNPNFKRAIRLRTLVQPTQPYDIQLSARNTQPIAKGDALLASFWVRSIGAPAQKGSAGFTFEQGSPDYKRSFGYEVSAGPEWKRFDFPFKSLDTYAVGEAVMNFRLGYAPQTIEIGGIALMNYATGVPLESLPATKLTYDGSEPDAPWRKAAAERIEKIRKSDLRILVRDGRGKPVPAALVTLKETRSAFPFGSAVNAKTLISDAPEDRKYQEMVKALFNRVVFENDLKWDHWESDRETPQKALQWLRDAGIETRGHVLVWPSWLRTPRQLKAMAGDPPAVRQAVSAHITDEVTTLRGQLHDWDVLNEPYKNHDLMDLLGPAVQADWFKTARQADPGAKLYLNDYGILSAGGKDSAHQRNFEETIGLLLKEKAPLDGIAVQGHFDSDLTPPTRLLEILDRYARFGLPIQITEFDVQVPNEALQADYTRDFLTTMFSHPSVNGILMWGFWEGRHYAPGAALWHKDWTAKANGRVWLDLVQKQWRTNLTAATGTDGSLKTRAFLGDYQITVTASGRTATKNVALGMAGLDTTIELK